MSGPHSGRHSVAHARTQGPGPFKAKRATVLAHRGRFCVLVTKGSRCLVPGSKVDDDLTLACLELVLCPPVLS
jgi:hypothetical protein